MIGSVVTSIWTFLIVFSEVFGGKMNSPHSYHLHLALLPLVYIVTRNNRIYRNIRNVKKPCKGMLDLNPVCNLIFRFLYFLFKNFSNATKNLLKLGHLFDYHLNVISLFWCGILLWLEVEDEDGETEKSGDGLEKLFWLAWRKFWRSCWLEWPTTNRWLAADCDSFAGMDERLLPPLIRGWNVTKFVHFTTILQNI